MPRRNAPSGSAAGSKLSRKDSISPIRTAPRFSDQFAVTRQARRLHGTIEQPAMKLLLETLDLPRDRRLRQWQILARAPDGANFRNDQEGPQFFDHDYP